MLKLIETVFNVAPLAAREESNDVGNLLSVLNLANAQASVPSLPRPGSVFPSSLCFSNIDPSYVPAGVNPEMLRRPVIDRREDDEATIFLKMINSGMLKGFPRLLNRRVTNP